jgi:hypothetical protein
VDDDDLEKDPKGLLRSGQPPLQSTDEPIPTSGWGNLALSSCPGKKVRLFSPNASPGARAPVCRDLRKDFPRIYSLGIRLIVW